MPVVVIHGDPNKPDEVLPGGKWDEDEFETLDRLKDALSSLSPDYKFTYLSNHDTLIDDLKHLKATTKIDLVFQLCDEGFNNHPRMELHAIAILEMLDLPFTGASSKCIGVTYDKQNVTSIAKTLGLPVPASVCIEDDKAILQHGLAYPVFIKPNSTDGSFGITAKSVCRNAADLLDALHDIRHRFTLTGPVLVQEYLEGIDVNVGVIGPDMKVLPITEEDYSALPEGLPKICGFESKWDETSPYWQLTSRPTTLTPQQQADVGAWSQKLFRRIDAHDYARFDWRMDSQGQPRFIEANPNCGWCWDGHLAKIAALAGHSYADMLRIIIESALERYAKANQARAQSPKKVVYLAHQLPAAPVEI